MNDACTVHVVATNRIKRIITVSTAKSIYLRPKTSSGLEFFGVHARDGVDSAVRADDAFARALSVELYREMSRSVFTASNMPILVAELMPAVSSYLTIRAASTAMRCHLPERDIRDIDDVPDAVDGEDAPSVMETAKTKIADVASATSASFTAAGEATTRAFSEMNRSLSKLWRP